MRAIHTILASLLLAAIAVESYKMVPDKLGADQLLFSETETASSAPRVVNLTLPALNLTLPDLNTTLPVLNLTLPDMNVTLPGANVTAPAGNVTLPGANVTLPGANVTLPGANVTAPDVNVTLPGANVTLPGANVTLPGANVTLPGANVTLPGANVTLPGANVTLPGANVTLPGANVTLPGANVTLPGANVTLPGANVTAPDANVTTPADPEVTLINTGDNITLTVEYEGESCVFADGEYTSDNFPDAPYPAKTNCELVLSTSEPRYAKLTAATVDFDKFERLYVESPVGAKQRLMSKHEGKTYTLLSSAITARLSGRDGGPGFQLNFEVLNSECHQIAKVEPGASGTFSQINYPRNTVCEYWIESTDSAYGIELTFAKFSIGRKAGCKDDFLAIDTSGDHSYETETTKYCNNKDSPTTVKSTGSSLAVLLNGLFSKPGGAWVEFTYSTFEL